MTTPAGKSVIIDTNILVYTKLRLSPFHQLAVNRLKDLESQNCEFWLSRQIFREYASVMSRPNIVTGTIPITSITKDIRDLSGAYRIAEDGPLVTDKWLVLLDQFPTAGKQVHDANRRDNAGQRHRFVAN